MMEAESLSVCTAHGETAVVRTGMERGGEADGVTEGDIFDDAVLCLVS